MPSQKAGFFSRFFCLFSVSFSAVSGGTKHPSISFFLARQTKGIYSRNAAALEAF
jgi:hypothetical protein